MNNKYIKILAILVVVVGVIAALYSYWRENSVWRAAREEQKKYAAAEAFMSRYDAAMKADTWGGKTPEETLQLFVAALEKGDIDLAAKYFMLETNENDPDYLTRRKWEEGLKTVQYKGNISNVLAVIKSMKRTSVSERGATFEVLNEDGAVEHLLEISRNSYSGVWKIESL